MITKQLIIFYININIVYNKCRSIHIVITNFERKIASLNVYISMIVWGNVIIITYSWNITAFRDNVIKQNWVLNCKINFLFVKTRTDCWILNVETNENNNVVQSSEKSMQNFRSYSCKLGNAGISISRILMTGNKDAGLLE